MAFAEIPYRYILGTKVNFTSYAETCQAIAQSIRQQEFGYVAIANVHLVMTGYWHRDYQQLINHAKLVTPDGMPLVWGLKLQGCSSANRVYGPDLTLACCELAAREKIPVYFYGSRAETLTQLTANLQQHYPDLNIAGWDAPPFRPLSPTEQAIALEKIRQSGAKLVFVGLGCPKQERWMAQCSEHIPAVLLGVGAAFDFHAGTVSQAPRWLMKLGLEWLYRLSQEPRRLWKRYLLNNPAFVLLFMGQLFSQKLTKQHHL